MWTYIDEENCNKNINYVTLFVKTSFVIKQTVCNDQLTDKRVEKCYLQLQMQLDKG